MNNFNSNFASTNSMVDYKDYNSFESIRSYVCSKDLKILDILLLSEVQMKRNKLDSALQLVNRAIQLIENIPPGFPSIIPELSDCYQQKCIIYFHWQMYSEAYEQIVLANFLSNRPNDSLNHHLKIVEAVYKMNQSKEDTQLKFESEKYIRDYEMFKDLNRIFFFPQKFEIPGYEELKVLEKPDFVSRQEKASKLPVFETSTKKTDIRQSLPQSAGSLVNSSAGSAYTSKSIISTTATSTSMDAEFAPINSPKHPPESTWDQIFSPKIPENISPLFTITPRSDWSESNNLCEISLFVKNIKKQSLKKEFKTISFRVEFEDDMGVPYKFCINNLYGRINTFKSSVKITNNGAEIGLIKLDVGIWTALTGDMVETKSTDVDVGKITESPSICTTKKITGKLEAVALSDSDKNEEEVVSSDISDIIEHQKQTQAGNTSLLHPDTVVMSEMFPSIPFSYISDSLNANNGNKELVSEILLNYDLLKEDKIKPIPLELPKKKLLKKQNYSTVKNNEKKHAKYATVKDIETKRAINKLNDVEDMMELLNMNGKDKNLVEHFYDRNDGIKNKAIFDMLFNFDSSLPADKQPVVNYSSLIPNLNSYATSPSLNGINSSNSFKFQTDFVDVTLSSERTKQLSELKEYLSSNKELQRFDERFYVCALKFFKGDVGRVLYLASNLSEGTLKSKYLIPELTISNNDNELQNDEWKSVKNSSNYNRGDSKSYSKLMEEVEHLKKQSRNQVDKTVKNAYNTRVTAKLQEAREAWNGAFEEEVSTRVSVAKHDNYLDLHELSVRHAISAAQESLTFWWEDELIYRERRGLSLKGVKAISGEFRIVTGRGIHSSGGISKIKTSIGKFLKESGYTFTDNTSSYTVTGKHPYTK